MKIALSNIAWDRSEDLAIAELMQANSVVGLDVAPGKLADNPLTIDAREIAEYIDFWKTNDVQIVGMQSMLYGHPELRLFADSEARQQTSDYLKAIILLAERLGVGPMVFGSPKNRQIGDMAYDEAFESAAEFFSDIADFAHEHSTTLCLEPNPVQYSCDFINTTEEALTLVKRVNHPGFRLHLDSAIMTMNGENIESALSDAIDWLAHFHISEPQLGVVKADGEVNHKVFAENLRSLGYDQWISIEMRGGWTAPDAESIEEALKFVTQIYG